MSRKNNRPQFHEPASSEPINNEQTEVVVVEVFDSIEDTIEVGEVVLVDGPLDPVPLSTSDRGLDEYYPSRHSAGPMPDLSAAVDSTTEEVKDKAQDAVQGVARTAQDAGQKAGDVVQDVTQKVQDTAGDVAGKAQDVAQGVAGKAQEVAGKAQDVAQNVTGKVQDVAQDVAGKAQETASLVADKAQDVAQGVVGKAQDVTQKVAEKAATVKTAAADALDTAKTAVPATKSALSSAASKIGTVSANGAQSVGSGLWNLFQRNPLQAIFVISSLVWLFRSNKTTASLPPVSLNDAAGDAAEKVGTVAGHVQVAATNLGSQVSEQASRSAGWFTRTLQDNPLAIGAMAIVFGAGLGFSVPESPYENKLLGKTRDELADKVQEAAQDLTHKVTAVAQVAVQEAVASVKEEAQKQGLSGELTPESAVQDLAKVAGKAQDAVQDLTQKVAAAAADEAQKQGLTGASEGQSQDQNQGS